MLLPDVNVLVAAHRAAAPQHAEARGWLVSALPGHPATTWVNPGRQHLLLLEELCRATDGRGDLVSDAVIAALAIEAGATVVSYDGDFASFRDVRWCTPG